MWDVAILLEPQAARHAALMATPDDIVALEANVRETELAVDNGQPFIRLDIEFHAMVARISGNRVLELSREAVGLLFFPAMEALVPHLPQAGRRNVIGHRRILDAITRRDADEAELWMRKQMIDFRRGYELAGLDMDAPVAWTEHARSGEGLAQ